MAELSIASSGGGSATLYTPKEDEEDEYDEHQIPFQFVHKFQVSTSCLELINCSDRMASWSAQFRPYTPIRYYLVWVCTRVCRLICSFK